MGVDALPNPTPPARHHEAGERFDVHPDAGRVERYEIIVSVLDPDHRPVANLLPMDRRRAVRGGEIMDYH